MSNPKIHLIHGFIGAGKTTFAKKLEAETGSVRFTTDEWMVKEYGPNPPQEKFAEYELNIKNKIWQKAEATIRGGNSVILDFGFWKRAEREEARQRGGALGAQALLYYVHCADEVAQGRVAARTAEMPEGTLFIDQNAFKNLKENFEAAGQDEEFIEIEN